MTQDDVLFGCRLQLFALAAERGVSQASRLMGVHRSIYYRCKAQVDRQGARVSAFPCWVLRGVTGGAAVLSCGL